MTSERAVEFAPDCLNRAWKLPTVEVSIPTLRRELSSFLTTSGLSDDEFYDLLLAVSEAASNAVEHAQHPRQPFIDVVAEVDAGTITITVRDHGQWLRPVKSAHRGRGLSMMRVLADTTVATGCSGTTVTIRKHTAATAAATEETPRAS
jgi:anti-sigma regulatory factor (Ser/Thr protein kinase)